MIVAMRVAVACIALSGCQLVFGPEDGEPNAARCAFGDPIRLTGLEDPTLKAPVLDGDTLWFIAKIPDEKIRFANLDDTTLGAPTIAMPSTNDTENDFGLSGDGLRLVFVTDTPEVFETTRADRSLPFDGPPAPIPLDPTIDALDLSFDGLTIIFQDGEDLLHIATRDSLDAPFSIVPLVDENGLQIPGKVPALSHDGLELFFELNDGIRRRTRPSIEEPFSAVEELIARGDDPELSNDGLTLVFLPDPKDHFEILRRECR